MRRPDPQTLADRSQAVTDTSPHHESPSPDATRLGMLVILGALVAAGLGYFIGLDDGKTPGTIDRPVPAAPVSDDAPTAPRYHDLAAVNLGPNAGFAPDIRQLVEPERDLFTPVVQSPARRADRRAYDGTPPVVPHPIAQRSAAACIACHANGKTIGERIAPPMSHAYLTNCTQCHAEASGASPAPAAPFVDSDFAGVGSPGEGSRAWQGAPPTIPHRTFMRESCFACHGPTGTSAIRTTHPWRTSCTQCHAPAASLDQRPSIAAPALPSLNVTPEPTPDE